MPQDIFPDSPIFSQSSYTLKPFHHHVIADRQYYSAEIFAAIRELDAEPVIPFPSNVKYPLISLWLTKRFKVKGDPRLVKLYRLRMTVERNFKLGSWSS